MGKELSGQGRAHSFSQPAWVATKGPRPVACVPLLGWVECQQVSDLGAPPLLTQHFTAEKLLSHKLILVGFALLVSCGYGAHWLLEQGMYGHLGWGLTPILAGICEEVTLQKPKWPKKTWVHQRGLSGPLL